MAITTEQIHAIADQLAQQGIKPTQTNVREALGGGSFTTIAEALRTWRQEQETVTQLQAVVIPQDITDRTQTLTAQIWETAQQLANERLAKEREALEHKEALMTAEVEEAQQIVKTIEAEQAELTAQLDELTNKATAGAEQLEQEQDHNRRQAEQIKQLETQLKAQQERADDLAKRLDQQADIIAQLTADKAKAEATATSQAEQLEQLRAERNKAQAEVKQEQAKTETHLKDLADLSGNFANIKGQNKTLSDQLTKAEALTQQQADKIEKLTAELATAKATAPKPSRATKAKQA
jgi:chromosome segregation ATPase